jgi:signal transduction histidine kinase/CheY-like chemotaxis protein/HAMP domain-containing protein
MTPKKLVSGIRKCIESLINKTGFAIRTKLIVIFVVIKVIPLIILALIARHQAARLGHVLEERSREMALLAESSLNQAGEIAVNDSVEALNAGAINEMERMSTDLAARVADFLYARDDDIRYAAELYPSEENYRSFIRNNTGRIVIQREWILSPDQSAWVPGKPLPAGKITTSSNAENNEGYQNRAPDLFEIEERPLFLEMTFIDLDGNETIKVTSSSQMDGRLRNVANRRNTYVRAETYWPELQKLKPGEIYVSDVIGAYTPSRLIGMYNPANVKERNLTWQPEEEAFAGRENPNGRRFKGIVRWAMPVIRGGVKTGYVTLALDHDHIMEFTDHMTPMNERYTELTSAFEGNYAFIWDYNCRAICHPRHHSIPGYNPETGEPEIPWLEDRIYNDWQASGKSYVEFIKTVPTFAEQSRNKKPAPELTAAGLVGLDGRYLNNAPQCIGWFDLTREGGSGSFLILWSGIWKPNTAAAIQYYTGNYGKTKRGFGFVAVGAGLEDFQRPAQETKKLLDGVITSANIELAKATKDTHSLISKSLLNTTVSLGISALLMIMVVVVIAVWLANILSSSINVLLAGISRFRSGERQFRFNTQQKDELGELAASFDDLANSLNDSVKEPQVITGRDKKIIYMNEQGLRTAGFTTLEEVKGRYYDEISIYPAGSPNDPILALEENREAEVLHRKEEGRYLRGHATWLRDKNGEKAGYVIASTDVTALVRVQKELEKTVQEANLANRHKGDFLARMSHEIRTPMNAIIGMTEILKKKIDGSCGDAVSDLKQIETSSHHLLGLINDILDLSKIEAGKIELNYEDTDIQLLSRAVESIIRLRCKEKNITFTVELDMVFPSYYKTDALRLRQVLINLLGNAVKFTHENGTISYRAVEKEKKDGKTLITFSVKDTGIGISENARGSLFKPFEQTSADISKRYGGTGLGLAISRSIVQLLGGDISVNSVEGEGSEFSFELWFAPGNAPEEAALPPDVYRRLSGKRALLVDDIEINRAIVVNLLESTGMIIDEAEDGKAALEAFASSQPFYYDIIYMDVQMPLMDGYESTAAIRALQREDSGLVPIVALTANAFKDDIDKALASGMNSHLAKPISIEKCIETTFKLLKL